MEMIGSILHLARTLLRFLQIDRRVDTVIEMELQRVIPLAEPPAH